MLKLSSTPLPRPVVPSPGDGGREQSSTIPTSRPAPTPPPRQTPTKK